MKSRDILTAQLGRKVTCLRPWWYFTVCWVEVTHMTSLSPEMLGRYSAILLPGFTTQIRKWLHLLSFRTRPVYQFYPEEVGQRGPGGRNHSSGQQKDMSACIFFNVCYVISCVCFNILQQEQYLLYIFIIFIIIHVMTKVLCSYLIVQVLCVFCLYIINLMKHVSKCSLYYSLYYFLNK